jgi:putative ABC transport system permease protein
VIGIVLGAIGAKILEAVTKMPTSISWEIVALGVVFSSLVGIIAGLQPAKRAAALQPIEAMRAQ